MKVSVSVQTFYKTIDQLVFHVSPLRRARFYVPTVELHIPGLVDVKKSEKTNG